MDKALGDYEMNIELLCGDALEVLRTLPSESVHCIVTSPPYYGLRDYQTGTWEGGDPTCSHSPADTPTKRGLATSTLDGGKATTGHQREGFKTICPRCGAVRVDKQVGLEQTPEEYVCRLVDVFREARRVLRADGTFWLNIGDSYNAAGRKGHGTRIGYKQGTNRASANGTDHTRSTAPGLKEKELIGIPWMTAFALRADGWYLRSEVIWAKKNPMPESVKDRPTRSHEQIFLLTKSPRYFYDNKAILEPLACPQDLVRKTPARFGGADKHAGYNTNLHSGKPYVNNPGGRNKRDVWFVSTKAFKGSHFATFNPELITPCILAGCPEGGTVMDPFNGVATTGVVAQKHGRNYIGIDLNPDYIQMSRKRLGVA